MSTQPSPNNLSRILRSKIVIKDIGQEAVSHPNHTQEHSQKHDSGEKNLVKVSRTGNYLLLFHILALACILFVPVWKIIDTSFLFRERDDPSLFDKVTDFFSADSSWPLAKHIDNGKDTYRVYFFILPFALGFVFLAIELVLARKLKACSRPKVVLPKWFRYRAIFNMTVLDLVVIAFTLTYSAILLWARTKRCLVRGAKKLTFLYEDSKAELDPLSWQATEIMALSLGVLTITLLGWFVLMPIGRRSALLQVLGIPWEVAVKYHRWLGWYTLAILLAHTLMYIAVWIYASGHPKYDPAGNLLRHMMVPGSCNDGACDEYSDRNMLHTKMMYGFAALFIMLLMCIFSINYIRRCYFEAFFYVHQLFQLLIIFTCFHYEKAMLYLLPGIVILFVDKTIRFLSSLGTMEAAAQCLTSNVVELVIKKDPKVRCEAGQYVFVNVPSVSILEWHPITVTWTTEDLLALHIRTRGQGTWTQLVHELSSTNSSIFVKLDGFHGPNMIEMYNLDATDAVLFVCGGCGLTFPFGILQELCQQGILTSTTNHKDTRPSPQVYLHWITRTETEYAAFEQLLVDATKRYRSLSISAWVTLHGQEDAMTRPFVSVSTPTIMMQHPKWTHTKQRRLESIYYPSIWRPFPHWLWAWPFHTLVIAMAILLSSLGYALTRKHEMNDGMNQVRAMLFERLFEILVTLLLCGGLLGTLVGLKLAWLKGRSKKMSSKRSTAKQTLSNLTTQELGEISQSDTGEEDLMECIGLDDDDDDEQGTLEVTGYGHRPDMAKIFENVAAGHNPDSNVAVLACGPKSLVDSVRDEYQNYIKDGWTMVEEEWEW